MVGSSDDHRGPQPHRCRHSRRPWGSLGTRCPFRKSCASGFWAHQRV